MLTMEGRAETQVLWVWCVSHTHTTESRLCYPDHHQNPEDGGSFKGFKAPWMIQLDFLRVPALLEDNLGGASQEVLGRREFKFLQTWDSQMNLQGEPCHSPPQTPAPPQSMGWLSEPLMLPCMKLVFLKTNRFVLILLLPRLPSGSGPQWRGPYPFLVLRKQPQNKGNMCLSSWIQCLQVFQWVWTVFSTVTERGGDKGPLLAAVDEFGAQVQGTHSSRCSKCLHMGLGSPG